MTRSTGEPGSQAKKRVLGLRHHVDRRRLPREKKREPTSSPVRSVVSAGRKGRANAHRGGDRDEADEPR